MNHLHFHFSSGLETWVHTCAPIQFRGVRRSVVLRDSLWPLCWAFRNLTQRTRRIATENTEGSREKDRNRRWDERATSLSYSPSKCLPCEQHYWFRLPRAVNCV